ncbi:amine oxidase [Penicillium waksmanii]|uniref:amine oxidase n=1 Tax=Penicillium waksmanii TaxID=69791 RepID=UPI002547374E|nr:amine oxidase [Penicillium waksmanii]KAJ5995470.1 amine oxidase [Penicillium waksmanii]
MTIKTVFDVIVVGAGLSGLQAAHVVKAAGLTVCVLEATGQVGGKTLTMRSTERGFNDLGAAWINDTNQSEMFKLFQRYGIDAEVQRACGDDVIQLADGSVIKTPYGQFPGDAKLLQGLLELLRTEASKVNLNNPCDSDGAKDIDKLTFREFCVQRTENAEASGIADTVCAALLGVESNEVTNGLGNQTISKKLSEELDPNTVKLQTPVVSIDQSQKDKCVIRTATGETIYCRKTIISIPTTLYHTISFNPPLPATKITLSDNAVMGYYSKMIFVFKEPWWRKAGFSGVLNPETGPISFTRDTSIPADDQWSITCFIVGERGRAWSKLSRSARYNQAWGQISQSFGKFVHSVPAPSNHLEMEWSKQAFFLGAPCPVMTPGTLTSVGENLTQPFKNIHFVGTETATVWRGYMEGAVRSGQRGGAEAVKALC